MEVDGAVHDSSEQQSLDSQRQKILESLGLKFVRVSSQQVESDLSTALKTIEQSFTQKTAPLTPLLPSWEKGLGDEGFSPPPQRPEDLTVCDPACGSGHILVYAFDLLFEIYREQGYLERDIPGLILTHNLFGLDIDERAVQLASFAVLMKARAKNSRILRKPPKLNITTVRSTRPLFDQLASSQIAPIASSKSVPLINHQLSLEAVRSVQLPIVQRRADEARVSKVLGGLLTAFEDADHLGSLITPPAFDAAMLYAEIEAMEETAPVFVELFAGLRQVVRQAELLQKKYWVVVANPPYMGDGSFNNVVKEFVNKNYKSGKGDLYGAFIARNLQLCASNGSIAMLTIPNWMFLSSFEDLRKQVVQNYFFDSLIHNGRGVFGSDFGSCSFTIRKRMATGRLGTFKRLFEKQGSVVSNEELEKRFFTSKNYYTNPLDFAKIPGSPIAYWIKNVEVFSKGILTQNLLSGGRLKTHDNERFIRYQWEPIAGSERWRSVAKGGDFCKFYGNELYVADWSDAAIKFYRDQGGMPPESFLGKLGICWSKITSSTQSFRLKMKDTIHESASPTVFFKDYDFDYSVLGFLNSHVASYFLQSVNPTVNTQLSDVLSLPYGKISKQGKQEIDSNIKIAISIATKNWNNFEISWDFQIHPLLRDKTIHQLSQSFTTWKTESDRAFQQLKQLEEQNNRYWIEAYGLQDELTPEVPDEQITIRRADLPRDIKSLISYAIGCMMGRYSLDHPGLIHAGQPFDSSQHTTFPADADAILPITDQAYFDDDIVSRFVEFIKTAYGEAHLKENLDFIAQALTLRDGESAQDRIRRYFLTEFISDHIQIYKKRPIYWLFTSGKNRSFGALVYLHRYTPNTIAQIRTDYVLELQRKLMGEITRTQTQLDTATSTTAKKSIQRRLKTLHDQDTELAAYQAKLQTVADRRIQLDLDDGVAYNYSRFKGLVYEGTDLKMADLEKKAQWKLDLLKSVGASEPAVE